MGALVEVSALIHNSRRSICSRFFLFAAASRSLRFSTSFCKHPGECKSASAIMYILLCALQAIFLLEAVSLESH